MRTQLIQLSLSIAIAMTTISSIAAKSITYDNIDYTYFAESIGDFHAGKSYHNNSVNNKNLDNALGAQDSRHVSMGIGGELTLLFGDVQFKADGTDAADILIWEGGGINETGNIFLRNAENQEYNFAQTVNQNNRTIDIDTLNFDTTATYDAIRVTDIVENGQAYEKRGKASGFDLDFVGIARDAYVTPKEGDVSPIPVPASGILLLFAIIALVTRRRFS